MGTGGGTIVWRGVVLGRRVAACSSVRKTAWTVEVLVSFLEASCDYRCCGEDWWTASWRSGFLERVTVSDLGRVARETSGARGPIRIPARLHTRSGL